MYVKQKGKPKVREAKEKFMDGVAAVKDYRLDQPLPPETYSFKSGQAVFFILIELFPAGAKAYQENQSTRNKHGKGDEQYQHKK